jgi:hypothetical protein
LNENFTHGSIVMGKIVSFHRIVRGCAMSFHFTLHLSTVFVTSKSYIYITPPNVVLPPKPPQISDHNRVPDSHANEPLYENIENGNIVPSDDNKFTIYVNYDEINGGKCKSSKSSVRLLEPDVEANTSVDTKCDDVRINSHHDDNDVENNSKTMSKMIQCQQISMYIGEKKN